MILTGQDVNHVLTEVEETQHPLESISKDDAKTGHELVQGDLDNAEGPSPTEAERKSLRRVHGKINGAGYVLCFVDGANNASYYGVTGVFTNFIQRPLPAGGNGAVSMVSSVGRAQAELPGGTAERLAAVRWCARSRSADSYRPRRPLPASLPIMVMSRANEQVPGLLHPVDRRLSLGRQNRPLQGSLDRTVHRICLARPAGYRCVISYRDLAQRLILSAAIPSVITAGHAIAPFILGLLSLAFASGYIKPA